MCDCRRWDRPRATCVAIAESQPLSGPGVPSERINVNEKYCEGSGEHRPQRGPGGVRRHRPIRAVRGPLHQHAADAVAYDALNIINFDSEMLDRLGGEMAFMQTPAREGKIAQGLSVARKS